MAVRYAKSSSQINRFYAGDHSGQLKYSCSGSHICIWLEEKGADMLIQSTDRHFAAGSYFLSQGQIFYRDAEFSLFSSGYNFIMMSGSNTRVDAQTHRSAPVDLP